MALTCPCYSARNSTQHIARQPDTWLSELFAKDLIHLIAKSFSPQPAVGGRQVCQCVILHC